jgi:hypothetical protein
MAGRNGVAQVVVPGQRFVACCLCDDPTPLVANKATGRRSAAAYHLEDSTMKYVRFLAAKTVLAIALAGSISITPAHAGIPVIDGGNLVQNIMTAVEEVAQTLKQIEEYRTQLQQYENMIQNTMAPAAYIWDQAQSTINGLMNAVDTLN